MLHQMLESEKKNFIRGYIVFDENDAENPKELLPCCYTCDVIRCAQPDPNITYLYSLIMFFGEEKEENEFFQKNTSLNIITDDASEFIDLRLEAAMTARLNSSIRIQHFGYNREYSSYVVINTHSFPPPRAVYKYSLNRKPDILACNRIQELVNSKRCNIKRAC